MRVLSRGTAFVVALFAVVSTASSVRAQQADGSAVPLRASVKAPTRTDVAEGRALVAALDARLATSPKRKGAAASTRGAAVSDARIAAPAATKGTSTAAPPPPPVRATPKRTGTPLREGSPRF